MSGWDGSLTPAVNGVGEEVEKEEGERRGDCRQDAKSSLAFVGRVLVVNFPAFGANV